MNLDDWTEDEEPTSEEQAEYRSERERIQAEKDKEIAARNAKWGHISSDSNWWSR